MNDLNIVDLYNNSSNNKRKDFLKTHKTKVKIDHNYEKNIIDDSWLTIIEDNIGYIDNILRNPNRFIINEEEIVKVELARRITVDSIKHLSKNTSLIQDIDEKNGDVKPSKILNINKEESFNTYENRFIYTLIRNLITYIDIKKRSLNFGATTKNDKQLSYQGESKIGSEHVNISLTLNSSLQNNNQENDLEKRLSKLDFQIKDLVNTELYKNIDRLRVALIIPPIKKTNLILKNTNFQRAVDFWNFLQEEMKDNSEVQKGNKVIEDDLKIKKLLDEAFLLNYFVLNSVDNEEEIDHNQKIKQNRDVLINNLIQKLVVSNQDITIDELGDMVNKQIQLVKQQTLADETEIKGIFIEAINQYLENVNNAVIGDEDEENSK